MKRFKFICFFLLALSLLAISTTVMAQKGTSRLGGTVKDSTGAVVAGASVTAVNADTGVGREVFTSESGNYVFPALPAGTYNVTAELPGFKRSAVEDLKLDIAATAVQDFVMEIGQLTETVTVTAAGVAPIQTTTSDIGDTVQGQTIQSLPLNGRNALELIQLNAGVAGNRSMGEKGSGQQSQNYGGLGANGARAVSNAIYLDGVDITNSEDGTGAGITTGADITQSVDAIGEFRVISTNPTAEFGKNSGMQVEIVTRSGTNDPHGSLYYFHRNTVLNANDFFNNSTGIEKPKLLRNQFGGTIGGPVYIPGIYNGRNKTFFFFNYEGFRQREGQIVERTVFTPEARSGLFRFNLDGPNNTNLVNPTTGAINSGVNFSTLDVAQADKERWDGIGKDTSGMVDRYVNLMPLPNWYGNPGSGRDGLNFASYRFNAPQPDDRNNYVVKVDQTIGTNHTVSVRYSHGFLTRNANTVPYPGLPTRTRDEYQRGVSINVISNLSSTVTNEFRFGFSRNRREFTSLIGPGEYLLDCDATFECLGTTNPDLTGELNLFARQTMQFTNNMSWAKNNHLFKWGFTFRSNPLNRQQGANQLNVDANSENRNEGEASVDLGQIFGGEIPIDASGNDRIAAANYFNFYNGRLGGTWGTFNAASQTTWGPLGAARVRGFRQKELGLFFQDDWRFSPKLTMNIGVRYELFGVPYEVNSFYTVPDRNLLDPQIDRELVAPPMNFIAIGPKNGIPIYPGDHNNFAPTVGFSYDPFGDGKTAIRAAYRISYDKIFTGTLDTIDGTVPGLQYDSTFNGDLMRDAGIFTAVAPGGLNQGELRTPRWSDVSGRGVGGVNLGGSFDLASFLGKIRDDGGNLPNAPLGFLTETRNSGGPRNFSRDFYTSYGQTWSLSIQREISRGTVVEARYIGRKGTGEYLGLPANEFRSPDSYNLEIQNLQYLLTGGSLGIAPSSLPPGYVEGTQASISSIFGSSPNSASDYSEFTPGAYDAWAFQNLPGLYPFFLSGQSAFDNGVASDIRRNDYVSTIAKIDNYTRYHSDAFNLTVPLNAVPSGNGLQVLPPERQPSVDARGKRGGLPIIVGIQPNLFRPNPQFLNGPRAVGNSAYSAYHSLQLQVQRRFYQGLQFQANYTWAKLLDITSSSQPTDQDAIGFYVINNDYSYSDNDITHNFKTNFIWEMPIGTGRKFANSMHPVLNHIIGGWTFASYIEAASDFPLNIAVNGTDRTAPASTGGIRPSWIEGVNHDKKTSQIGEVTRTGNGVTYFDSSAFDNLMTRTLISQLGDVPRNYWRGPGFFNIDLTLSKFFTIHEQKSVEFRAEFFNLLNNPNFANPDLNSTRGPYVNLNTPDAGRIIETLGNPRLIQFALKFRF